MPYTHYERLSALDATFLEIEDHNVHMHVGAVCIFEGGRLLGADGALDIERIRRSMLGALQRSPRFRQRLAWIPGWRHPVWVDDDRFNLHYHLRHTSLPRPGDARLLKRLAGRIVSQKLDRGKPLWETWFIEGLPDGRFAVISKIHHCLIDGISGVDLLGQMLSGDPDPTLDEHHEWLPRPAPSNRELLAGEVGRRASLPWRILRAQLDGLRNPGETLASARDAVEGLGEALGAGLRPASATPLNPDIGPHRRFDWSRFELAAVKEVKNRLGGTVNDVVLATVSGAVGRFLRNRGVRVEELDFRSMVPVSVRTQAERGRLGNRVSFLLAQLPLDEVDPRKRLQRVIETTQRLKGSKQVLGAEVLEQISDWVATTLFVQYARLAARSRAYNMVVTNVPGPQVPVYLLGSRMLEIYPLVPLFVNQALGIALFSYDGSLFWGFNSDWDALPDLHDVVTAIDEEFEALRKAAAAAPPRPRSEPKASEAPPKPKAAAPPAVR